MKCSTKLVRDGNSWAIRLSRPILQSSGLKSDTRVLLVAKPGQITIYSETSAKKLAGKDKYEIAKQDAREAWDEAFEQVWIDIFGVDG